MTKDELVRKCENQRGEIARLRNRVEAVEQENEVLRMVMGERTMTAKVRACMAETLSLIEDVEWLKNQLLNKGQK